MTNAPVAFYGDDFTGSVDALLQFDRLGLRARLFVGLPTQHELAQAAADSEVIGVAGIARSLPPDELAAELAPVLAAFMRLGARVVQYKACSTADSSPTIGSLGRVIELGRQLVSNGPVPLLFAQPDFGRYTVFGHHFAAENGTVYRLDRQPTMSTHPSTPMHESDLALHIRAQTEVAVSHLAFTEYGTAENISRQLCESDAAAIVLDAFADEQLLLLGAAVLRMPSPVFAIGSGGLSQALATAMTSPATAQNRSAASAPGDHPAASLARPGPILAVSGSRSARTQRQIAAAEAAGWRILALPADGTRTVSHTAAAHDIAATVVDLLADGQNVALTSHDVTVGTGESALAAIANSAARIIHAATEARATARVIVCGGDTSSRVTGLLGIRSLSIAANPWANVVLLSAEAPGTPLDGVELLLKGGQVGDDDLFENVRRLGE